MAAHQARSTGAQEASQPIDKQDIYRPVPDFLGGGLQPHSMKIRGDKRWSHPGNAGTPPLAGARKLTLDRAQSGAVSSH